MMVLFLCWVLNTLRHTPYAIRHTRSTRSKATFLRSFATLRMTEGCLVL